MNIVKALGPLVKLLKSIENNIVKPSTLLTNRCFGTGLLNSYSSNRKQYVPFGGIKSSLRNIMTGVPQGSIFGLLLFIIYTNDINKASSIFRLLIYADDTTLHSPEILKLLSR